MYAFEVENKLEIIKYKLTVEIELSARLLTVDDVLFPVRSDRKCCYCQRLLFQNKDGRQLSKVFPRYKFCN